MTFHKTDIGLFASSSYGSADIIEYKCGHRIFAYRVDYRLTTGGTNGVFLANNINEAKQFVRELLTLDTTTSGLRQTSLQRQGEVR